MKKIFYVIICVFCLCNIKLNAAVYTVTTDEEVRDEEGSKETVVTSTNELEKGITLVNQKQITLGTSSYTIRKVLPLNLNETIIVGDVDTGARPYQGINRTSFPFIMHIKNNTIVFNDILDNAGYGIFYDVTLTPNGYCAIGYIETSENNNDIICSEFTFEGCKQREIVFKGSMIDEGYGINYQDGYLNFVGITSSNDFDFKNISQKSVCFGVIEYNKFLLMGIRGAIEEEANLLNVLYDENYVYFSTSNNGMRKVLQYTKDGEAVNFFQLSERSFKNMNLTRINDQTISYETYSSNDEMVYYQMDKAMEYCQKKTYSFNEPLYKLDSVIFKKSNDKILLVATMSPIVNGISRLKKTIVLDDKFKVLYENKTNIIKEEIMIDVCDFKDVISSYSSLIQNFTLNFVEEDLSFIKALEYFEENNRYTKIGYRIRINNADYGLNPKDDIDVDKYQTVTVYEAYSSENLSVFLPSLYECKIKMNVVDNEKYDVGVVLSFNGKGYLNGVSIQTNHKITSPGVYTLKVLNNKGEEKSCSFVVEDMSFLITNSVEDNEIKITRSNYEESLRVTPEKIDFNITKTEERTFSPLLLIILTSLILGILAGFLFLKLIKKWRCND